MVFDVEGYNGLARWGKLAGPWGSPRLPAILWPKTRDGVPGPQLLLNPDPGALGLTLAKPLAPAPLGFHMAPSLEIPPGPLGPGDIAPARQAEVPSPDYPIVSIADGPYYLRHPRDFVEEAVRLRRAIGPGRPLYAPGLAAPWNLAALIHLGVDLVDGVRLGLETALGRYLTPDGSWALDALGEVVCPCPGCAKGLPQGLDLHNRWSLVQEMSVVRRALAAGALRELVEKRLPNDPWCTAVVRHLDLRHQGWQQLFAPVVGPPLRAYSHDSLTRPEVVRFRDRVRQRYARPPSARVLLLVPCSARKPYSTSRSHGLFRTCIEASGNPHAIHTVVVTSPLGIVPGELELAYPAGNYDIPVTGDWNEDEKAMVRRDLEAFLAANRYDAVVAHLGAEEPVVADVVPGALPTGAGRPTSPSSLEALARALRKVVKGLPPVPASTRRREDMGSRLGFQFGPRVSGFMEGCEVRGRYPRERILRGPTQLAMLTEERGMVSLTLDGAASLAKAGVHVVEIEDFYPRGNVFAVGVEAADPDIRIGDEAIVVHRREVRGVGVATMPGPMMAEAHRGEAVRLRHRTHPPGKG